MTRQSLFSIYVWSVTSLGLTMLVGTTVSQAPADLKGNPAGLLAAAAILVTLTFLSTVSPMETAVGTVTVSLAPLFGAILIVPPWAVMLIACLGTLDLRVPGRDIPWPGFLFNRAMYVLTYGVPSLALYWAGVRAGDLAWYLAIPVVVLGTVALNVGQVATYFSLLRGDSVLRIARRMLAGRGLTYIALPLVGYMIWALMKSNPFPNNLVVFLLYGPLLVYRASLQKQNRLDKWLRDSFIMQSRVVDKRDGQTFGHSQRVGELSEGVARLLHMNDETCNTIRVAGILHDLGKIAIPDSILLKPGKLTPEEYEIIKSHPTEGAQILAEHPEQKDVAEIVMHHHERWDGKGYPDGLQGQTIPLGSRIVNAVDAFDTITQARVFRPTVKTPAEAIHELRTLAGTWYDPDVISALEKIVAERWGVDVQATPSAAAPPAESPPGYRTVLAIVPFRRLWLGQAVSYFGDMMNTTGLAIMLFLVTHSAALVALGLIAKGVPTVLFGLVAGSIVDRFNRQRLMILADILRAILTVMIPFFALRWLPGVFIDVFLVATASSFFNPAKQSILPNLVPGQLLIRANGLISSSEKLMELLGYSAAGVIAFALTWIPLFLIDSATYLVSAVTLLGVPDIVRPVAARGRLHLTQDIQEGTKFILARPALRATMLLSFFVAVPVAMTYPILVVLSYGALNGGAAGYGFLEAAIGGGAIIGAIAAPAALNRYRAGSLILLGVAGVGLSTLLTGVSHNLVLGLAFLFLGGISNMLYYVPLISVTQREAPDHIRGRVMASRFLLVQAGLLAGMALAGPLYGRIGAPMLFVLAGGLVAAAAVGGLASYGVRNASINEDNFAPIIKATASS